MKNKPSFKDNTNTIEQELIKSLYTDKIESNKDWSYLLQLAIYLIKNYEEKHDLLDVEFAYYIFLKYAVQTKDYRPLFDFSTNFGFYPITKKLYDLNKDNSFAASYAVEVIDEKYKTEDYVQTFEQKTAENKIEELDEERIDVSFIAPTSFGKSESIINLIKRNSSKNVIIIEPSRALLAQMASNIHNAFPEKKVIVHEEMYNNDENFIAVLTQERAIRLITKHNNLNIGIVCIDEAHNLLDGESRSLLLSVLVKVLKDTYEPKCYYYSPVIVDSDSLRFNKRQHIKEVRINFNLKEPEIFVYKKDNAIQQYNRFLDKHYDLGTGEGYEKYIIDSSNKKNFIFVSSPRKIEQFANYFSNCLELQSESEAINNLIDVLKTHVNEKFYLCNLLKKGILYLHAKIPDIIKEYLIYKYETISEIKYLVANTVILEGMNLPIDTLFILSTYRLDDKRMINLIGRVNRLNYIFHETDFDCKKLLPPIHFVDSEEWNSKRNKMENAVEKLATANPKDKIENPLLSDFDGSSDEGKQALKNAQDITDSFLNNSEDDELKTFKKSFYKYGLNKYYKNKSKDFFEALYNMIKNSEGTGDENTLSKMSEIFVLPFTRNICDFEFLRLQHPETIDYYEKYYSIYTSKMLSEKIKIMLRYIKNGLDIFYVGSQYGEITDGNSRLQVFINKRGKSEEELVNIAIAKIKIEDDFISYSLNNFINLMYEYKIISDEIYNKYIFGSTDEREIQLYKNGMPSFIVAILNHDGQLNNIEIKDNGECSGNSDYQNYKNTKDDFVQYHLERYIK